MSQASSFDQFYFDGMFEGQAFGLALSLNEIDSATWTLIGCNKHRMHIWLQNNLSYVVIDMSFDSDKGIFFGYKGDKQLRYVLPGLDYGRFRDYGRPVLENQFRIAERQGNQVVVFYAK